MTAATQWKSVPDPNSGPTRTAPTSTSASTLRGCGPTLLFAACFVLYAGVGIVLTYRYNLIDGDGPSRVANAGYTIFSRDPHLGAIGFVWNPLPSIAEIPLLLLSTWWPELKTLGLAGTIQSAAFMSAAVLSVRRIALDRHLAAGWRWCAVGGFALNPMIVEYGAIGLSEAAFLFFTLCAVRRILRWEQTRAVTDLAVAGFVLGAAYLVRYEAVIAVAGAVVAVAIVSYLQARDDGARKWRSAAGFAVHDALIVAFPALAAFVFWAIASWVLTGEALSQITSPYGNDSQVAVAAAAQGGSLTDIDASAVLIAARILGMQPLILVVCAVAILIGYTRRRLDALIPIAVFGSVLAFQAAAQLTGTTFGWFRFYIFAIPLTIVTVMSWWTPHPRRRTPSWASTRLPGVALAAVAATSLPITAVSMLDPAVGNQSVQYGLASIISPQTNPPDQHYYFQLFQDDRAIASWLDEQNLPPGSVLSDTFQSWGIWLASNNPDQFVITSDFDFSDALNFPVREKIRYILVSDPIADAGVDAINTRYPTLWDDGSGLGHRIMSVNGPENSPRWRIYNIPAPDHSG